MVLQQHMQSCSLVSWHQHYQALSSTVQALFEQAIAEKSSQHFPLLWRCYMSYEMSRGRFDAARRVLLRAVHTCPGAKALWLDGLHFLAERVMPHIQLHISNAIDLVLTCANAAFCITHSMITIAFRTRLLFDMFQRDYMTSSMQGLECSTPPCCSPIHSNIC